jgi:Aminopeptidase N
MKLLLSAILIASLINGYGQASNMTAEEAAKDYHPTPTKINDLVHTRLDVKFDYTKSWMYGKAWITLHPHFYPTDTLNLDAKGMSIEEVSMVTAGKNIPLRYTYDSMNLRITLNRVYRSNENYTVYIRYISMPNGYKAEVSSLMPGEKGLYFINPRGEIKGKPTQIWTQGETEGNSYWFPTIDKPNQKTTDEISMTVPAKYLTLSNGSLVSQKTNGDGTRTDKWKMDLPHAPYLLFMGVGEYAVIKDNYEGKEVSYYVEKEYAPYAREIFGKTPEMIKLYSRLTGVDYPWPKYAQITGRDYIFGAMENTSATLHAESAQQDARQLVDGNNWEDVISHELFHQWFGDYVTTESWSNITVNESFADYGETLWNEYKYGKEKGQETIYNDLRNYLGSPANADKNLVRFNYKNAMEAFDGVGYQKGGCIIHMLRNYVGDSAFFKSIGLYLSANKFKNAEAQNLRLAFEEVTGKDLNWFFNQWYYNHGHPKLDISYDYSSADKTARVFIKQTQSGTVFKLPMAIDVYDHTQRTRYNVWMNNAADTFSFHAENKPELINVDAEKVLLCEKTDHKTAENFIYQYNHAASYIDRREAIAFFLNHKEEPKANEFLKTALKDKTERLRRFILQRLDLENDTVRRVFEPALAELVKNDPKSLVRADAIDGLGGYKKADYKSMFIKAIDDSSYSVAGKALEALAKIDSAMAFNMAKSLSAHPAKGILQTAILDILSKYGDENSFNYIYDQFNKSGMNTRFNMLQAVENAMIKSTNTNEVKKEVDVVINFRDNLPSFIRQFADPQINGGLRKIADAKSSIADYIRSKIPATVFAQKEIKLPVDSLQKYIGNYEFNGNTIKIELKGQILNLVVPGQPEYPLAAIGENKFYVTTLAGFTIQFNLNDKGEVTELVLIQPNGTFTAKKTK